MSLLSLAHFTVIDAGPLELIDAGAAGGFDAVGLRLVSPPGAAIVTQVVGDEPLQRSIRRRLRDTGLKLLDVEAVWLLPETELATLRPVLDTAADLGARYLVVSGNDPERRRMTDNLARLCEECHGRGLRVMLEFLPYTTVRNLADASELLSAASPRDAGILVDALHLSRSGGSPADLAAHDPALFSLVHLCDAPALPPPPDELRAEARGRRLYPGEGGLWLEAFLRACPEGAVVAVEAPSARDAPLPPAQRARLAAEACRAVLARAGVGDAADKP